MKKLSPHLAASVLFASRPNPTPPHRTLYHQERTAPKQPRCPIAVAHAKEILG